MSFHERNKRNAGYLNGYFFNITFLNIYMVKIVSHTGPCIMACCYCVTSQFGSGILYKMIKLDMTVTQNVRIGCNSILIVSNHLTGAKNGNIDTNDLKHGAVKLNIFQTERTRELNYRSFNCLVGHIFSAFYIMPSNSNIYRNPIIPPNLQQKWFMYMHFPFHALCTLIKQVSLPFNFKSFFLPQILE